MVVEDNLPGHCGGAGDPAAKIRLGSWDLFEGSEGNFMKC